MTDRLVQKLRSDWEAAKDLAPAHRADAGIEAIVSFIEAVSEGPMSAISEGPSSTISKDHAMIEQNPETGPAAFLGVDYDEFKPETYRGVFVHTKDGQGGEASAPFNSGIFVDDLHRAQEFLSMFQGAKHELSSYHNYLSDIAKLEGSQTTKET